MDLCIFCSQLFFIYMPLMLLMNGSACRIMISKCCYALDFIVNLVTWCKMSLWPWSFSHSVSHCGSIFWGTEKLHEKNVTLVLDYDFDLDCQQVDINVEELRCLAISFPWNSVMCLRSIVARPFSYVTTTQHLYVPLPRIALFGYSNNVINLPEHFINQIYNLFDLI